MGMCKDCGKVVSILDMYEGYCESCASKHNIDIKKTKDTVYKQTKSIESINEIANRNASIGATVFGILFIKAGFLVAAIAAIIGFFIVQSISLAILKTKVNINNIKIEEEELSTKIKKIIQSAKTVDDAKEQLKNEFFSLNYSIEKETDSFISFTKLNRDIFNVDLSHLSSNMIYKNTTVKQTHIKTDELEKLFKVVTPRRLELL